MFGILERCNISLLIKEMKSKYGEKLNVYVLYPKQPQSTGYVCMSGIYAAGNLRSTVWGLLGRGICYIG